MLLATPDHLHYPITVTKLLLDIDAEVTRNSTIFKYDYSSTVIEGSEDCKEGRPVVKTFHTNFQTNIEGTLSQWHIRPGQVITRRGTAIAEIEEPCKHGTQFGGMCADCGKDMTTVEYNTTIRDTSRATVNTVHGHTALLVSKEEASRSDEEAKRRLLSSRKLSLVVDLDQTIIHATVDPTVAEWQNDPTNPNHGAVKDVQKFQLLDDSPGARGCWYYIKLRPGLKEFLDTISKCYELHIYTMGTRAYAQHIARIVDPDRRIFADRILSRDESGSMTVKSLKRLFPVDTKMVVIIDDRGDVWQWSQNLVKVTPYDFFVGIGDINSSFLPKRPELEPRSLAPDKAKTQDGTDGEENTEKTEENGTSEEKTSKPARVVSATPVEPQTNGDVSAIEQLMSMGGANDPNKLAEQTTEQDEAIAAQLADRPLLQKQKQIEAAEGVGSPEDDTGSTFDDNHDKADSLQETPSRYKGNLLVDNDTELTYLGQSLRDVHKAFFEEYDRRLQGMHGGRVAELRPGHQKKRSTDGLDDLPDVTSIMAAMKNQVLRGVSIVFSGIVPIGVDFQSHDLAVWAKSFGATITDNIKKRTTHVIAAPQRRTAKVRQAARHPDRIKIVSQHWLWDCLSQWNRLDEGPYRVHVDIAEEMNKSAGPNGSPLQDPEISAMLSSSDDEAAVTEEEGDAPNGLSSRDEKHQKDEAELAAHMPTMSREESSPHADDKSMMQEWADELAEFMGSDDEDGSESDAESIRSEATTAASDSTPSGKRKRPDTDGADTNGEESDASVSDSRLQKRKRKALARTSSLNNATATGTKSLLTLNDHQKIPISNHVEEDEEDEDDLAAELEAGLAEEDDDTDDK